MIFDDLNDALFAQMEKLQSIDPKDTEQMDRCIEQSKAVSGLAGGIIANANTYIKMASFQADIGMDTARIAETRPKMLNGGN